MLKRRNFLRILSLALLGLASCGQNVPPSMPGASAVPPTPESSETPPAPEASETPLPQASVTASPQQASRADPSATQTAGAEGTPAPSVTPGHGPAPRPTEIIPPPGWKLVWHDEFDGPAGARPDPAKWTYDLGAGGWGNNELEYYTNRPENVAMDGKGALAITAIENANPAVGGKNCAGCRYSSARLLTRERFDFLYGRFEARLRLTSGQGLWPAFWLLGANYDRVGWPQCGEIDILENRGSEPGTVHANLHGPGYSGGGAVTGKLTLVRGRFADGFHVFAVEWDPAEIRWYMDGYPYCSAAKGKLPGSWVFDHPFYIILNLAVGGNFGGAPDRTTVFPQSLLVDYVRVYQR